jgi:hypothetical protein
MAPAKFVKQVRLYFVFGTTIWYIWLVCVLYLSNVIIESWRYMTNGGKG